MKMVYRVAIRTFLLACAFGVGIFAVHGAVAAVPFLSMFAIPGYALDMWELVAMCLAGNWLVAIGAYALVAWIAGRRRSGDERAA
jgi:hypothetical protein